MLVLARFGLGSSLGLARGSQMPILRIGWFLRHVSRVPLPGTCLRFRDKYVGPFQKCTHNRAFVFDVMIRFEVQVLIGVGWFSVHGDMSTAVVIDVYTGVQEGEDPVAFWFGCENNVRVNTVDMSCELLYVVFMDLGESVIHVPEPQGWRVRCSAQSSFFEHLHVQVGNDGGHW